MILHWCASVLVIVWGLQVLVASDEENEIRIVGIGESGSLVSPGYPLLPANAVTDNYTVTYGDTRDVHGLALLFNDLDLPPSTTIMISGLNKLGEEVYGSPLPRYTRAGWTRPFILLEGAVNFQLVVDFGIVGKKKYVGYNVTYWVETADRSDDIPFTDCPPVTDVVGGGKLVLETISLPMDRNHYRFDCVWLLKLPPASESMSMYLRIYNMDLSDGRAIIVAGNNSKSGIQLAEYSNEVLMADADDLRQPEGGFPSTEGFYVRVWKPTDSGSFAFGYGVYTDKGASQDGETECEYTVGGMTMTGYHCQRGATWCVPSEYKCNELKNCPHGDDEDAQLCNPVAQPSTTTPASTTTEPPCEKRCESGLCISPWYTCPEEDAECEHNQKKCSDGSCVNQIDRCTGECFSNEKECPDGSCIERYKDCVTGCDSILEKACPDGSCVSYYGTCPLEDCPSYKPERCRDGTCYYSRDRCDNVDDCVDGTDETSCSSHCASVSKESCGLYGGCYESYDKCDGVWQCPNGEDEQDCESSPSLNYVAILVVVVVIFIGVVCIALRRKSRSMNAGASASSSRYVIIIVVLLVAIIAVCGFITVMRRRTAQLERTREERERTRQLETSTGLPAASAGTRPYHRDTGEAQNLLRSDATMNRNPSPRTGHRGQNNDHRYSPPPFTSVVDQSSTPAGPAAAPASTDTSVPEAGPSAPNGAAPEPPPPSYDEAVRMLATESAGPQPECPPSYDHLQSV